MPVDYEVTVCFFLSFFRFFFVKLFVFKIIKPKRKIKILWCFK